MRVISEMCALFIPSGITDHLWSIADSYKTGSCVFYLRPLKMGEASVQDIRIDVDGFSFHHTILGFHPVSFTVEIKRKDEDLVMSVVPSDRARREIRRWERVKAVFLPHGKKAPDPPGKITLPKAG